MKRLLGFVVVGLMGVAMCARASVIHVPAEQASIGQAIAAAATGDTILVAPGTYSGPSNRGMSFLGKQLVLQSEAGPLATVINCESQGRAFLFNTGETLASVVDGFTIASGRAVWGGGLRIESGSSVTVRYCVFAGCRSDGSGGYPPYNPAFGGAVYSESNSLIANCSFFGNTVAGSPAMGCAMCAYGGTTRDCLFSGNTGGELLRGPAIVLHCIADDEGYVNPGENMWNTDPALCGQLGELCSDSFALPYMNPWGEYVGALGIGCGPCNTPVERKSWGSIKALYHSGRLPN
jgi:Right handed beta helix region